ncbi:MAG TPA: ATP-binding cassette domain-containing protein [bacterium]|nr:ATP-binding cassette domain-containing protein [bacterium]
MTKSFGNVRAVNNLSFDIATGEVVGFVGPNGAGKSTTMRVITGYLAPSSGEVTINGLCVQQNPLKTKAQVGYLPESSALYDDMFTIDFLRFAGGMRGLDRKKLKQQLSCVIEQCDIASILDRKMGTLSKGFRQRVGLAQAFLHDPPVLILDEPTIGLDPNQVVQIRTLLKNIGKTKTVLLSSHILSELTQTCDRLLVIHNGSLVAQGTADELRQKTQEQNQYHICLRGNLTDIENIIRACPFCLSLTVTSSQDDKHHVAVVCSDAHDHSEDFFQLAVANNWQLNTLTKNQSSLESVFQELTQ